MLMDYFTAVDVAYILGIGLESARGMIRGEIVLLPSEAARLCKAKGLDEDEVMGEEG